MADILCVVAHPDDESFGAGAFLAWMAERQTVKVVTLSDGVGARMGRAHDAAERRRHHFRRACEALGATYEMWHLFQDQQSDLLSQLLINREVERFVSVEKPHLVVTHHVGDLNLDHRRVAEAVLVATRGGAEVWTMSPEWPARCVGPKWKPRKEHKYLGFSKKVEACLCYADEIREYPHPRSERAIREQTVERFMEIR